MFDELLPAEHDQIIMDLLFEMATWHSLAKLRLHTESTVTALEASTNRLGIVLRKFVSVTCEAFDTRELPSEEARRGRQKAALAKKGQMAMPARKKRRLMALPNDQGVGQAQRRRFSLNTYKLHALGDYSNTIRLYGTPDNYSSQTVCLESAADLLLNCLYLGRGRTHTMQGILSHSP